MSYNTRKFIIRSQGQDNFFILHTVIPKKDFTLCFDGLSNISATIEGEHEVLDTLDHDITLELVVKAKGKKPSHTELGIPSKTSRIDEETIASALTGCHDESTKEEESFDNPTTGTHAGGVEHSVKDSSNNVAVSRNKFISENDGELSPALLATPTSRQTESNTLPAELFNKTADEVYSPTAHDDPEFQCSPGRRSSHVADNGTEQLHRASPAGYSAPPTPACHFHHYPPYRSPQFSPNSYPGTIAATRGTDSADLNSDAIRWLHKLDLLQRYKSKFGHCEVPPGYGFGTEYNGLFEWVLEQRHQHQLMINGESTTMTPTRAKALCDIGFLWSPPPTGAAATRGNKDLNPSYSPWQQKLDLLQRYKSKFGHCEVPPGYGCGTEYSGLFEWVLEQRYQHQLMVNGEYTTMTPTRAKALSDIGFPWAPASPPTKNSEIISGNISHNIHSKDTSSYSNNNGTKIDQQKLTTHSSESNSSDCHYTDCSKNLAQKHSKTGDIIETNWKKQFDELRKYKQENGHTNVPRNYSKNPSLFSWVNKQRFQYLLLQKNKPSLMTEEKIIALNSIDFKWPKAKDFSWNNWLKELQKYKDQHGDVNVPHKYKSNKALGAFVNRQRNEFRKLQQGLHSSLDQKRISDLESLGFKWSTRVPRTPWEKRFNELKQFKANFGHANVPTIYPKNQPLAHWVLHQRGQYRTFQKQRTSRSVGDKSKCYMTPARIRMLNEIGFDWNPRGMAKLDSFATHVA